MSTAITVEGLSKCYTLGEQRGETMLREAIVSATKRLLRGERAQRTTLWALQDVSFTVNEGEVVGIIGRNGAGKSTLLKLLSRITHPTRGTVRAKGRIASLLEVGTGFHEELTGRENVYLNGSIMGMKRSQIDRQMDRIVEFAGVQAFMDTPIKRYSSGMRLRLGFAVAAHLEPDILLVDEVLAVGDIDFQKKCLQSMDDLRGGGRTVLFVSHNMAAVEHLCPRSIWIHGGQVRQDGPTREVVSAYMGTFANVRQGSGNLKDVTDRTGNGQARFTGLDFLDAGGNTLNVIRTGDKLVIRIYFETYAALQDFRVGVEFLTDLGLKVTASNNWATGFDIERVGVGPGYMDLQIDTLPLMPGRYYLSLYLGRRGNLHDVLQNCIVMDVESSDYYRSGRGIDPAFGLVFLPCRWASDKLP